MSKGHEKVSDVKFALISGAASDNTLVPAVSGKKIRVLSYALIAASAVNVTFESGTTVALTGAMPFGGNGGIAPSPGPFGHFETATGALLNLKLSDTIQVSGHLSYHLVEEID